MMIAGAVVVLLVLVVWAVPWFAVTNSGLEELERHTAAANLRNGLVSALLAVGAGGSLAYTMRTFHMNQTAHLIGRFESAAKQIGDKNGPVRLAGLYAMAQLADVWTEGRQACIEVLCAHVRQPVHTTEGEEPTIDSRETVLDIVALHLRDPFPGSAKVPSWDGCDFNLSGAVLKSADLSDVVLRRGRFRLNGTHFSGTARFDGAEFAGAVVSFEEAVFESESRVSFDKAKFLDGSVSFDRSKFLAGVVSFNQALFEPRCRVTFAKAEIGNSGSLTMQATINGGVRFDDARFLPGHGEVSFDHSEFLGPASFDQARFRTDVSFRNVKINSSLSFREAHFEGKALIFDGAASENGIFDLADSKALGGHIDLTHMNDPLPLIQGRDAGPLVLYPRRNKEV